MPRRILEGKVVADQNDKTVTVLVERRFMHPVYKKYVKRTDKYAAHDPANAHKVGEKVSIIETKPISKNKRWIVTDADGVIEEKTAPKKAPAAKKETVKKAPAAKKPAAKKPAAKKEAKSGKDKS